MATPEGMRSKQYPVNSTDAVRVDSDETHIWLQPRPDVATDQTRHWGQ